MTPSEPLSAPQPNQGGNFDPMNPGPQGGFPAQVPGIAPQDPLIMGQIQDIVTNARRIGMKYPGTAEEVRTINAQVAQILQKVMASQPSAEPMAPPL